MKEILQSSYTPTQVAVNPYPIKTPMGGARRIDENQVALD
jgi:hypothetical protein